MSANFRRTQLKATNSPKYQKFLRLLLEARKSSGKTQAELARMLQKHQSYVSKYESGERRLDVIEYLAVCEVLGINPSTIIKKLI